MNVIHLKHDQFKINAAEFSNLREEAYSRLSFAIWSFSENSLQARTSHAYTNLTFAILRFLRELALYRMRTSFRLHMQTLYRLVILQAKCTIRIQALSGLLYLSHPPETGNGGKRSFDKGSDEEEKNVFWYLAFLNCQCVKATTINSH